jgi:hypothetical protein
MHTGVDGMLWLVLLVSKALRITRLVEGISKRHLLAYLGNSRTVRYPTEGLR